MRLAYLRKRKLLVRLIDLNICALLTIPGLDKAIMSTVADFRKNIPDSAYSYLPNLPFSPLQTPNRDANAQFSSIPSSAAISYRSNRLTSAAIDPRPLDEASNIPTSTKAIQNSEREIAELRLAMVGMGKAMNAYLEQVARRPDGGENDTAWAGLERVRDTLLDAASTDVEDIVKEWGWHDGLEAPPSRSVSSASLLENVGVDAPPVASDELNTPAVTSSQELQSPTSVSTQIDVIPTTPKALAFSHPRPEELNPALKPLSNPAAGPSRPFIAWGSDVARQPVHNRPKSARETEVEENGDPLAGLGVGLSREIASPQSPKWLPRRSRPLPNDGPVDPLLGVGVR
jgi:TBC1 domain family protein 5